MDLPDLKKLNKIIALCRKQGVETIEIDNIKITLKDAVPSKPTRSTRKASQTVQDQEQAFQSDGWDSLSEEDKLLWSSGTPAEN